MAESGSLSKSDFLQVAEKIGEIRLRFAMAQRDGKNSLIFLDGEFGDVLDQREDRTWAYDSLSLFERTVSGSSFKQFIEDGSIPLNGQSVPLPEIRDSISWTRYPSHFDRSLDRLAWPTTEYALSDSRQVPPRSGLLIGRDAPSFQSYDAAVAAFLELDLLPGHQFNRNDVFLRCQNGLGRITKVVWSTTTIDVTLEGCALMDSVIELASPMPGETRKLSDATSQMCSFNVPATGLPSCSWLVLRRDGDWLDYKYLNWPHAPMPDVGVEIVVEGQDKILSLISQGEGPSIEFKEGVPAEPNNERYGVCKTIAAFANGLGGTILLGVADDGSIKGVPDPLKTRNSIDAITNWIKNIVSPLPDFDVQAEEVLYSDELGLIVRSNVIVISVGPGSLPPYGIKPGKPEYFVRRGATTFPAAPEQLRNIVQKSLPAQSGLF